MTKKQLVKKRLTAAAILEHKPDPTKSQTFVWDTLNAYLGLRISAGGKRSLVWQRRTYKGPSRITLATIPTPPKKNTAGSGPEVERIKAEVEQLILEARDTAALYDSWANQGKDPREELANQEAEEQAKKAHHVREQAEAEQEEQAHSKYTLAALLETYAGSLEKAGKARSARQVRSAVSCHVLTPWPDLAAKPARDVTADDILTILGRVFEQGKLRTEGILRAYIHRAFAIATKKKRNAKDFAVFGNFGLTHNPVADTEASEKNPPRERHLSETELGFYLAAIGDAPVDVFLRAHILAGGQRVSQLLRATVDDWGTFEGEHGLLLHDGKGRRHSAPRPHLLPLAPRAAAIVQEQVERAKRLGKRHIFFAETGDIPHDPGTPGKRIRQISEQIGGESFQAGDLRRTSETLMTKHKVDKETLKYLLSHGFTGDVQERVYNKHTYFEEKQQALVLWEKLCTKLERAARRAQ